MKTLYKFIPLDSNDDYAFKNLENGVLTATKVSKLWEHYPEEMIFKLNPEKYNGKISFEECKALMNILVRMLGDQLYITCFTTNKDFKNEERLKAYGKDLILARYHDSISINSKIASMIDEEKLIGATMQVSYFSKPLDMTDYYSKVITALLEYIRTGLSKEEAEDQALPNIGLKEFFKQLIRKPSSYSWENEWRLVCKSVTSQGDRAIPNTELYPVVATDFYPSAIYYSPKFLSEDSHNFQRIKKFTSEKKIPLIKI